MSYQSFFNLFQQNFFLSNDYKWQRKLQEEKVTHVYIFNFLYLLSFFEFFLIYSQSNSNSSLFFLLEFLPIPSLETLSVCTEKKLLLWTFPLYSCYFHPRFLSAWIKDIFLMDFSLCTCYVWLRKKAHRLRRPFVEK